MRAGRSWRGRAGIAGLLGWIMCLEVDAQAQKVIKTRRLAWTPVAEATARSACGSRWSAPFRSTGSFAPSPGCANSFRSRCGASATEARCRCRQPEARDQGGRHARPLHEGAVGAVDEARDLEAGVAGAQADRDIAAHRVVVGLIAHISGDVAAGAQRLVAGDAVVDVAVERPQVMLPLAPKANSPRTQPPTLITGRCPACSRSRRRRGCRS